MNEEYNAKKKSTQSDKYRESYIDQTSSKSQICQHLNQNWTLQIVWDFQNKTTTQKEVQNLSSYIENEDNWIRNAMQKKSTQSDNYKECYRPNKQQR